MLKKIAKWFKKKGRGRRFTEAEREHSQINRTYNAIKKKQADLLKQRLEHLEHMQNQMFMTEKIEELEADLYREPDDDDFKSDVPMEDQLLMKMINRVFPDDSSSIVNEKVKSNAMMTGNADVVLSDQEIINLIKSFPEENVQKFRKLPTAMQVSALKQELPELSDVTIKRAIHLVNSV